MTTTSFTTTTASPTNPSDLSQLDVSDSASSTDSRATTTTTRTSSRPTNTSTLRTSFRPSTISVSSPSSSPSPSQVTASAQTSSAAATPSTKPFLTSGQIAGISVAAVVVFILLLVGAILCIGLIRRRRQQNRDSGFIGFDTEPFPFPPPEKYTGSSGFRGPNHQEDFACRGPPLPEKPNAFKSAGKPLAWSSSPGPEPQHIGLALSPDTPNLQQTPMSTAASRATSKLLPDKPSLKFPTPVMTHPRPISEATFIEDDRASYDGSMMMGLRPRASMNRSARQSSDRSRKPYPALPPAALMPHGLSRPTVPPTYLHPSHAVSGARADKHPTRHASNSTTFSNGSHDNTDPRLSALVRLYTSQQPAYRHSTASDTSFESNGEAEDDTPLTPLQESPDEYHNSSPISPERLNYPKVPRPLSGPMGLGLQTGSREAPPPLRIPPRKDSWNYTSEQHDENLLAKRRGDDRARELRLQPATSYGPSAQGQWRVVDPREAPKSSDLDHAAYRESRNARQSRGTPGSEWTPKFTPTRRGEDLFLEVS
ncbi:MAG: hypothetical protein M4579_004487 [Chaenotheca gracillima]|nr:MAG: hypothetical protein M4579_004487 [Chaenotheca gracillima]